MRVRGHGPTALVLDTRRDRAAIGLEWVFYCLAERPDSHCERGTDVFWHLVLRQRHAWAVFGISEFATAKLQRCMKTDRKNTDVEAGELGVRERMKSLVQVWLHGVRHEKQRVRHLRAI